MHRVRELLAVQKVVGSNPFSRFREGLRLQAFSVFASPDTRWGPRPERLRSRPLEAEALVSFGLRT
jgi:hypothetical protein